MIFPYTVDTGENNMNFDLEMLETSILNHDNIPKFRLYGWEPACVSLGRNQKDDFINKDFLSSNNINIVRRVTGGRALLHKDEITYCFVCPVGYLENGESVINSYHQISQFLINSFKDLGINIEYGNKKAIKTANQYCMLLSTGADLCYQEKKIIGSAQYRKNGYILQHGSILLSYDSNLLQKIFSKIDVNESIISVKEINPEISKENLINILYSSIKNLFPEINN